MSVRPPGTVDPPFDFDEAYAQIAERMRTVHLSRIAEMPKIELYLDQLLSFVRMELAFMCAPEDKIITGAMVNNYVKQRLLPAPRRRRYTRRHLASLMFVCVFKQVFSIAQITQIRNLCMSADIDVEQAYDELVCLLESSLAEQFTTRPSDLPAVGDTRIELMTVDGTPVDGEVNRVLESGVSLVTRKVYLAQLLSLEQMRAGHDG